MGRLFVGPVFWPARDGALQYEAVAVDRRGVVTALYPTRPEPPPPGLTIARLPGALAVPGLGDAHLHLAWIGRSFETLELRGAASPAAVRVRVEAFAAAHPAVAAVTGDGWDQTLFPGAAFPSAADLGPGGRPVVLTRVDGHALWLNDVALQTLHRYLAAGAPGPGERVLRDARGAPTGVVIDPTDALRAALATPVSAADHARWLRAGMVACADAGLVEVHFMAASPAELDALVAVAEADGGLPLRVAVYLDGSDLAWAWLEARPAGVVAPAVDVRVLGIKLFADGALGSRGAALGADYADEPGHRGPPVDGAGLAAAAKRAAARGLQVAIHAIGDRGNAVVLDVFEAAGGGPSLRHRVEHAQVVDPADWGRFVALGAVASMQPTHATSDARWAQARLGAARLAGAYAWRTALAHGIPLAFGSDAPIESWRPTLGINAAITRQDAEGEPPGGFLPEQRLSVAEAVRAFSAGVAFAAHNEGERGTLAVGRPLDLTIFDRDPRDAARGWLEARPTATVRDGVVRRAP